jgi:2-iminobutanoate/2-iminopropanoate deaminase
VYYATVNAIYAEYFGAHKPARTFVCTAGWFGPFDIEMDCVAIVRLRIVVARTIPTSD